MKTIDIKSLLIGALLTSSIFLGVAATSKDDAGKWDDKQEWAIKTIPLGKGPQLGSGYEPIAYIPGLTKPDDKHILYRKRIK